MHPSDPSNNSTRDRADRVPIARLLAALAAFGLPLAGFAAQTDIPGPLGSVSFGTSVTVLPNGNFVVTDPNGPVSAIGAVYLYSADGVLISTLTGSTANDQVGNFGVIVVGAGNFVVMSPAWHDTVGAATWVDGSTGLDGIVSSSNSLVGSLVGDLVGASVTVLGSGNYVVASSNWSNGASNPASGAATWGSGGAGVKGLVSAANSLVGSTTSDYVAGGGVVALSNGNYVVASPKWHNGGSALGAATWGNGNTGTVGAVGAANSLTGATAGDAVATSITALRNGNYVVASPDFQQGGAAVGAATWVDGTGPFSGVVTDSAASGSISMVGANDGDHVGSGGVVALSNGNFVVVSPQWNLDFGAVTWGDGVFGSLGVVGSNHSLTGSTIGDAVGQGGVTALSNGNYVVATPGWQNGGVPVGASTWVSGTAAFSATISADNSLCGTTANDGDGMRSYALADGNYAVAWPQWTGNDAHLGAVVWGDGTAGATGPVLPDKSLHGDTGMDRVGINGVLALKNGNAVAISSLYSDPGALLNVGAWTWMRSGGVTTGTVGAANSVVGFPVSGAGNIGSDNAQVFADGYYAIASPSYEKTVGAVYLANGAFRAKSMVHPWNSVIGGVGNGGASMTYGYDATRHRLIVGRPAENIVTLFTTDQLFADDFSP